jgi:hypothetical protein
LETQASRIVAGIRFLVMASCRARPVRVARGNLEWAPAEPPAVQAGVQVPASRRAKSPPVLSLATTQPGKPGAQRLATAPQARQNPNASQVPLEKQDFQVVDLRPSQCFSAKAERRQTPGMPSRSRDIKWPNDYEK